jgi:Leucine-rich repeat (LRR) protein
MRKYIRGFSILVLGIVLISLSGCATCKTSYRRELSNSPNLREANESYKKAIDWLDKAECSSVPAEAERSYRTAESYLSDAIFKLKEQGHNNNINVSEDTYYCEKIKRETDVKIGAADRAK